MGIWRYGLVTGASMLLAAATVQAVVPDHPPIVFSEHIKPIFEQHCIDCHGPKRRRAGLSLDTRALMLEGGESGPAIVPGDSKASLLIKLVTSTDIDMMPADGDPLPDEQIALLRLWIDQGAHWDDGTDSLTGQAVKRSVKPRRPDLPDVGESSHPIDRILNAYFATNDVAAAPVVDDATFARRLYMDVIGLPPTPQQLQTFLDDTQPDKRERLVHSLLDDKRGYTEHWLTFWNDMLRNDYAGTGYIDGGRKQISQWLYDSLYHNKPFDQFVRELIVPNPATEGFINGIQWRGNVNASQTREIQFSQNISQVFMGVNMKCASCHDSFVDEWKLADAYALAAVFAEKPLEMYRCDVPTGQQAVPGFIFPEVGNIDPSLPRDERLAQLADLLTHEDNGRVTRTIVNRLWGRFMGRALIEPVDIMANEPWSRDLLDYLAVHLVDSGYDLKQTMALILTSRAYQLPYADQQAGGDATRAFIFRGPTVKRLTAEQFVDAVRLITGTGPAKAQAPIGVPKDSSAPLVRASMMRSDLLMRSLGRPNREQVVTTRPGELSTLQALDLTNGTQMSQMLRQGADNLAQQYEQPRALIEALYLHALSRRPTDAEIEIAAALLGSPMTTDGIEDFLWSVFMLPEFQLVR